MLLFIYIIIMINDLEMIDKIKQDHNQIINELVDSSEILAMQCEDIDEELEVHNYLLDKINDQTEKNETLLERVNDKLEGMLENFSNSSLMCSIFILLMIRVFLILL